LRKKNVSTTISRIAATHCTSSSAPLSTCPATSPLWSWSRARSIDRCTSSEVTPSGASASAICPAPRWTLSATAGTWLTNGGITSAHSPTNAANASRTDRKAAGGPDPPGAQPARRRRQQRGQQQRDDQRQDDDQHQLREQAEQHDPADDDDQPQHDRRADGQAARDRVVTRPARGGRRRWLVRRPRVGGRWDLQLRHGCRLAAAARTQTPPRQQVDDPRVRG